MFRLKTPLEIAIEALEHISNPLGTIEDRAKAQGRDPDWRMMILLADSPAYLKGIASDTLALLKVPSKCQPIPNREQT